MNIERSTLNLFTIIAAQALHPVSKRLNYSQNVRGKKWPFVHNLKFVSEISTVPESSIIPGFCIMFEHGYLRKDGDSGMVQADN